MKIELQECSLEVGYYRHQGQIEKQVAADHEMVCIVCLQAMKPGEKHVCMAFPERKAAIAAHPVMQQRAKELAPPVMWRGVTEIPLPVKFQPVKLFDDYDQISFQEEGGYVSIWLKPRGDGTWRKPDD